MKRHPSKCPHTTTGKTSGHPNWKHHFSSQAPFSYSHSTCYACGATTEEFCLTNREIVRRESDFVRTYGTIEQHNAYAGCMTDLCFRSFARRIRAKRLGKPVPEFDLLKAHKKAIQQAVKLGWNQQFWAVSPKKRRPKVSTAK